MKKVKVGDNMEVEGIEELEKMFRELPVAMQKETLLPAIEETAKELNEEVRNRAPVSKRHNHTGKGAIGRLSKKESLRRGVAFKKWSGHTDEKYGHRSGFLRDTIGNKILMRLGSVVSSITGYSRDAFYGYFVEKGTSRMKGTRFMTKAFNAYAPRGEVKMAEIATERLNSALEDAKSKSGMAA